MTTSLMVDVDAVIDAANNLEPLPTSVMALIDLMCGDDYDITDVVKIVETDPPLAGAVLRSANSAASGPRSPVATVRDGVVRMGPSTVLTLALGRSVEGMVLRAVPAYGLGEGELWKHSVAASVAADVLQKVGPRRRVLAAASTAALLHDIGKVVLGRSISDEVGKAIAEAMDGTKSRFQAEREVLDVHHGEIGGIIAQSWRLPLEISAGIVQHHTPDQDDIGLAAMVYLSDLIADTLVQVDDESFADAWDGAQTPGGFFTVAEEAMRQLDLEPGDLESVKVVARRRYAEVSSRL